MYDINYWLWSGVLSEELCDSLILEGDKFVSSEAQTGTSKHSSLNHKIRNTNLSWFPPDHWSHGICMHYAQTANHQAGWMTDISHPQPIQYTRYFPNEHYMKHRDSSVTFDPKDQDGFMRKLSVVIQLSNPETYEGGNFLIENMREKDLVQIPEFTPRGSVLVFPSIMEHTVKPVTKGVRHSMVCWVMGPRYR
jgi:PKHD-type hydroxylase